MTQRTTGIRHSTPKAKRKARKVNGAAYWMPILVAINPEPQIMTKYHARKASAMRGWVWDFNKIFARNKH